jgi:threonylcarbamoyladenosine tRNA methylthiotransferase MtaB
VPLQILRAMKTFSIENFGCRATDADAASLRQSMLADGWLIERDHERSDVVILNSCTVTSAADTQAREAVRKIHRANPEARIVVTGCYAQRAPEEIAALQGVHFVVGNSRQSAIPGMLCEAPRPGSPADGGSFIPLASLQADAMSLARGPAKILTGDIFAQDFLAPAPAAYGAGERTRPILKIQDGCDNRCAYCVIPLVRGKSRSMAPGAVVATIQQLAESGAKEIVLSGINLGSYGRDFMPRVGLVSVVRRILDETNIEQLRFSSIEPQDVTEEFVSLVASSGRIAPHFHIPLQSGSDRILRAMHRWYRTGHYAERIQMIRRLLPEAAIGADVIAGFPGEMDADFQETVDFIERMPLTYLHVFSFSPRPRTKAEGLDAPVPFGVIRERARTLRALCQRKAESFRRSLAGRRFRALTLARGGGNWTEALTGNYLKARIPGRHPANQWHDVDLTAEEVSITFASPVHPGEPSDHRSLVPQRD